MCNLNLNLLKLYFYTIRYLRFTQIFFRVYRYLISQKPNFKLRPLIRNQAGVWVECAHREASLVGPYEFIFLNKAESLTKIGWNNSDIEKLWLYNLHYFDDLNAKNNSMRMGWHINLLSNWVEKNPPGVGFGWDPYPTSLRIVNWIKWSLNGNQLSEKCLQSLAIQTRWLEKNLEKHLLGNHIFANAKALVFSGLFFEGPEAERWLRAGLSILKREIPEQIMSDGGHFELSTMYHLLIFEDMLDLCNLLGCYKNFTDVTLSDYLSAWQKVANSMLTWMNAMRHPDGEISFFNDAAICIAPSCSELEKYSNRLGVQDEKFKFSSVYELSETGYVRIQNNIATAFLDMARIGPDYLPGHAHADTFTFELSLFNHRVIVNSGTSTYAVGEERMRQRGTAAHNTVIVGGENSSEVWGSFRVARRAYPINSKIDFKSNKLIIVESSHNGYFRFPEKPVHKRKWSLGSRFFQIEDFVRGTNKLSQARFHFHPEVRLKIEHNSNSGILTLPNREVILLQFFAKSACIESTTWHPEFGLGIPNQCLVLDLINGSSMLSLKW